MDWGFEKLTQRPNRTILWTNLWQSFRDFVLSLRVPQQTEELMISCAKVQSLLHASVQPALQDRLWDSLRFQSNVMKSYGEGFQLSGLLRCYEFIFEKPKWPILVFDVFQLKQEEDLDTNFFQLVWSTTDYDQVIVWNASSIQTEMKDVSHFRGEKIRLKVDDDENNSQPLQIQWCNETKKLHSLLNHAVTIKTKTQAKILFLLSEKQQAHGRFLLYQFVQGFYQLQEGRFPLTAQNFLLYLFFYMFDRDPWILQVLQEDFSQCASIIQAYS